MPRYTNISKYREHELFLYEKYFLKDLSKITNSFKELQHLSDCEIHHNISVCKARIDQVDKYLYESKDVFYLSDNEFDAVFSAHRDNKEILNSFYKEIRRRNLSRLAYNKRCNALTQYDDLHNYSSTRKCGNSGAGLGVIHAIKF